ncbi:MAG: hypothetical protein PHS62_04320 [Patescibacteria group bacterium]|nr:hypothetical protein [Patescibacteria group bacterium]
MKKLNPKQKSKKSFYNLRVRIIRAPLVDNTMLREVLTQRQRALVL